jgi:uncharacterized DUF497 family protein
MREGRPHVTTKRAGNFEWDESKGATNLRKHGITFDEAAECFLDPQGLDLADTVYPDRMILIGYSRRGRILLVVYAERHAGAIIRIISARRATSHEKKLYQNAS